MKRAYRDSFVMAYCISEESIVCRTKADTISSTCCRDVAREITGPQKDQGSPQAPGEASTHWESPRTPIRQAWACRHRV